MSGLNEPLTTDQVAELLHIVPSTCLRHARCHHVMRSAMHMEGLTMRTTLVLDDDLLAEAQRLTGVKEKTLLVRAGLAALIERESARRLARLGGSEPELTAIPRRRSVR